MYDYSTGKWKHYVTIVTPETNVMLQGDQFGGFLENFNIDANNKGTSIGYYRNSWSMNSNGAFSKPAGYEGSGGGPGYWNAESAFNNTALKLTSCGIGQPPATYPRFVLNQPGSKPPSATPVNITNVTASYANSHVTVNWITDDYTSPQLSYKVKIYNSAGSNSTPIAIVEGIRPDTRSTMCAVPANSPTGTYWASVELVDIFNQSSNFGYSSFIVNAVPVAGINTGIYYKIKNVASGLYLDVENSSIDNNAFIPQTISSSVTSQQWKFQKIGTQYLLINRKSNKLLTVLNNIQSSGAQLIQYVMSGAPSTQYNQQWDMVLQSPNTYIIKSNMSEHYIADNPGASPVPGTRITIYPQVSPIPNNERWILEPFMNTATTQLNPDNIKQAQDDAIVAYPNPVKQGMPVKFNLPSFNDTYQLKVFSSQGIVVKKETLNNTRNEIDTKSMAPGIYYYQLHSDKKDASGKFVVE